MSSTIFHRRRAERFAQLLDEANGGRRHHVRSSVDDDLAALVSVGHRVSALQDSIDVQPDPEFRVGLRAMLVAAAERESMSLTGDGQATVDLEAFRAAASAKKPARVARRVRARGAIVIGVAAGAVAVSGMSMASENSMPGDALYGVKRSTEKAQVALAGSDLTKGQLYLDFASNRLAEAKAVGPSSDGFVAALDDMDANTLEGVKLLTNSVAQRRDPAALDALDSFVNRQTPGVSKLLATSTGDARDEATESMNLLMRVTGRSNELRDALRCESGSFGAADNLGPTAKLCATAGGVVDGAGVGQQPAGSGSGSDRVEKTAPPAGDAKAPAGTSTGPAAEPSVSPSDAADDPAAPTSGDDDGVIDDIGRILGGLLD